MTIENGLLQEPTRYPPMPAVKTPIGLRPRHIVSSLRIREIAEAIGRYAEAGKKVPQEWLSELYVYVDMSE